MIRIRFLFLLIIFSIISQVAWAYVGPGLALSTILITLGVIGSLLLAILSVIYYPIKRLIKKNRSKKKIKKNK